MTVLALATLGDTKAKVSMYGVISRA